MPKGCRGEKRPADVIGAAIKVAKIATGEITEDVAVDGMGKGSSTESDSPQIGSSAECI